MLLAALLRLWGLTRNQFGNTYYAAAVRSMLESWHTFFFASFDPAGVVSVDKPPVALWVQTASARLLGFSSLAVLLPQALEGLLSVALVYALVRRRFDRWAALLAALAMAVCPIAVAVDRFNNVDSCLVLILLLAAVLLSRATETARRGLLLLAMAIVGIAFNSKMMAAFVVLPAFYLLYFVGAAASLRKRLADLSLASLVLFVVSLSWPLAVDLTPPGQRPFVGSTQDNSMITLSLGWNGFQRLLSRGRRFGGPEVGARPSSAGAGGPAAERQAIRPPGARAGGRLGGRRMGQFMVTADPGPLRLTDGNMASQVLWLLPLALLGLLVATGKLPRGLPIPVAQHPLLLWSGWLASYAVAFSFMRGAMHVYYMVMLGPPMAALLGIGCRALWLEFREGKRALLLPLGLLATAGWQMFLLRDYPEWEIRLLPLLLAGSGLGALGLVVFRTSPDRGSGSAWMARAMVLGLAALFLCPLVWSLTPVLAAGPGGSPDVNPNVLLQRPGQASPLGGRENTQNPQRLLEFLKTKRHGEQYLVAAQNVRAVAPIIIQTGEPAIALGGFSGGDPALTVDQLAEWVHQGRLRYMLLSDTGGRGGWGPPAALGEGRGLDPGGTQGFAAEIATWVREHGQRVDPGLWQSPQEQEAQKAAMRQAGRRQGLSGAGRGPGRGFGASQLYDLRPELE
jgi:4-amino-4-deoxy-L-arabinose transferase-like glycosyltransferase